MPAADDKERLGESLYNKVLEFHPELAGKITETMLDSLKYSEIEAVLDDEPVLREKVDQALRVLNGGSNRDGPRQDGGSRSADKQKIQDLQDELEEAEKWAEDMQRQWDEKEARWKKEKDELMSRVAESEGRAKVNAKSPTNGADKTASLNQKAEAAEKRVREAEARNVAAEKEVKEMQERMTALETSLDEAKANAEKAQAAADAAEKKAAEAEKVRKDAEGAEAAVQDEVKTAEKWCEDMVIKFKTDLAAKEKELEKANKALEELQSAARGKAVEATADVSDGTEALRSKLQEVEASRAAEKGRGDEAERRARAAEAEAEAGEKAADKGRSKADKCRELQQDLENAHREIKSYKAQLKASKGDGKVPDGLANAQRDARAAKDERARVEKRLSEAQSEIAELKKKLRGAGAVVESPKADSPKKAKEPKESKEAKAPPKPPPAPEPKDEEVDDAEEEEEEDAPEPEPKEETRGASQKSAAEASKHKVQQTSAGKASKKKTAGSSPTASTPTSASKHKPKSSFKCTGTHVVAGCLAAVVMIQLGLFVYEGWFGEQTQWSQ